MTTNHTTVDEVRTGSLGTATHVFQQTRPVEYHAIGSLTIAAGGAGANYACPGTGTKYDIKGLKLQLSFAAVGNNMVGGDALTVYFYQLREGTYYLLDTKAVTTLATTAGSVTKVEVACDFADSSELHGATHFAVAGNVAVAAGGATGSTVYVDYDLFADEDVALEFSGTIGAVTVAAIGTTTDAPVADITTVEDNTARTAISLLKRLNNMWIAFLGYFKRSDTAPTVATKVLPVQNINESGEVIDGYIAATNHLRNGEISPVDTRDVLISAIASNATINNTALYYPAAAATPTSNWDSFTLNANGGKATRISFNGSSIPPNTKTAIITLYASNDPNATSASKRWTQIAFIDDMTGNTVTSLTMTGNAGGTAQPFAISVGQNFDYRYLVMLVTTNDNTTAVYIDGAAGY
jgi:hypothetical protein